MIRQDNPTSTLNISLDVFQDWVIRRLFDEFYSGTVLKHGDNLLIKFYRFYRFQKVVKFCKLFTKLRIEFVSVLAD
jgi:hypothetical protein